MKKLTEEMLVNAGACEEQVDVFKKAWPNGATITIANYKKAVDLELSVGFLFADIITTKEGVLYDKIIAKAWDTRAKAFPNIYTGQPPPLLAKRKQLKARAKYRDTATKAFLTAIKNSL